MCSSFTAKLINDPGVLRAKNVIEEMRRRGFRVFINPSGGVMLVGERMCDIPSSSDMDEVYAVSEEIQLYFAIYSLNKHFVSVREAESTLKKFRLQQHD